jgi:hypothetical protein
MTTTELGAGLVEASRCPYTTGGYQVEYSPKGQPNTCLELFPRTTVRGRILRESGLRQLSKIRRL